MSLVEIAAPAFDVDIDLAYATPRNITGAPVYRHARCYLREAAAGHLGRAIRLAASLGLHFRIFDAWRPTEAQWTLWNARPDPESLADPSRGSPHSRGAAIDLTLIDGSGAPLDMGTGFDDFAARSYHANPDVSAAAQRNRAMLLGLMTAAGWDFYHNEWWHYQLFDSRRFPLLSDTAVKHGLMWSRRDARGAEHPGRGPRCGTDQASGSRRSAPDSRSSQAPSSCASRLARMMSRTSAR